MPLPGDDVPKISPTDALVAALEKEHAYRDVYGPASKPVAFEIARNSAERIAPFNSVECGLADALSEPTGIECRGCHVPDFVPREN